MHSVIAAFKKAGIHVPVEKQVNRTGHIND